MRFVLTLLLLSACTLPAPAQHADVLVSAFPGLSFDSPVDIQAPPGGGSNLYVVERPGRIVRFSESGTTDPATIFLDIRERVVSGGEQGLLGMATFDFYVLSALLRLMGFASPIRQREILLRWISPTPTTTPGRLQFGPDGYLYVGLGDGGSGGDPEGNGQKTTAARFDSPPRCGRRRTASRMWRRGGAVHHPRR